MDKQWKMIVAMAHPDDETFGMGGTIAYYSSHGIDVQLICATKGEAGEVDARFLTNGVTIGELRQHELECAAKKLGISRIHWLGYRDSGMQGSVDNDHPHSLVSQPISSIAEKISQIVISVKPDIVVTFDPIGGYRHPDHITMHKATKLAFENSMEYFKKEGTTQNLSPMRLYFHTFPRGFFRFWVKMIKFFGGDPEHYGKNKDINFLEIANVDFPIDVRINYRKVIKLRNEAYLCHASQGGAQMRKGIFSVWEMIFGAVDIFTQMIPEKKEKKVYRNLFYDR